MRRLPFLLITVLMLLACRAVPSREEALSALRASQPGIDTATVTVRVWVDGPPWFSCAEVIAKLKSEKDRAVVRDALGQWRSLVLADWVTLRDTAAGPVVEPGWCVATLRDTSARLAAGWRRVAGDSLPSGGVRRGWDVRAGMRRVGVIRAPRRVGDDSARVDYVFTVAANASGVALGANRDTIRRSALLAKENGTWRLVKRLHHPAADSASY